MNDSNTSKLDTILSGFGVNVHDNWKDFEKYKAQAKADLIELIKSSKPERAVRDDKKLPADANSTMIYNKEAHNNMVDGYNHALYEYEKNLLQAIGEIK